MSHVPVLLAEVVNFLNCKPDCLYLDATLGEAGHTLGILERTQYKARIIGLDSDEEILKIAEEKLGAYKDKVTVVNGNFRDLDKMLKENGISKIDGALFDLGVSSFELESKDRGFSFRYDSKLDMRMDRRKGYSAFNLVNELPCEDLERIFRSYGEERFSKSIARNIERERQKKEIMTTFELVEVIKKSVPEVYKHKKIHFATRTFQALRIIVNDELNSLREALEKTADFLNTGARICVISFHSLEDRIVKNYFKEQAKPEIGKFKIITKKPVTPSEDEMKVNSRSRSAKLRVAERI